MRPLELYNCSYHQAHTSSSVGTAYGQRGRGVGTAGGSVQRRGDGVGAACLLLLGGVGTA